MSIFDWFANRRKETALTPMQPEREIADGLWTKCEACGVMIYSKDLHSHQLVCPECGHHHRVSSSERIQQLIDPHTWRPLDENLVSCDPLQFKDRKPIAIACGSIKRKPVLRMPYKLVLANWRGYRLP